MIAFYLSIIEDAQNISKFEKIYYAYNEKMYVIAFSILHDHHYAEEAVQDAFIKVAKLINTIKDDDAVILKAFLIKVIKNSAIDIMRKKEKNKKIISLSLCDDLISNADVTKEIEEKEIVAKIRREMLRMPEIYRDVLELNLLHNLSVKEISLVLNLNQHTVRTRLTRGKNVIKILMKGICNE